MCQQCVKTPEFDVQVLQNYIILYPLCLDTNQGRPGKLPGVLDFPPVMSHATGHENDDMAALPTPAVIGRFAVNPKGSVRKR